MATVTPNPVYPVNAPFNTTPAYSGTFIPTLWYEETQREVLPEYHDDRAG